MSRMCVCARPWGGHIAGEAIELRHLPQVVQNQYYDIASASVAHVCVCVSIRVEKEHTRTAHTHTHAVRKLDRIMHFNKIFRTLDAVPCTCYLDKEDEHSIKTEEHKIYVDISQTVPMPAITSGLISLDSCNRAQ